MSTNFQNLDRLSESLYQELIEKAESEIAVLKEEAAKEREQLLHEAKVKAEAFFKEEERKLKQIEQAQINEVRQRALQIKQDLQNEIINLIHQDSIAPALMRNISDQELMQSLVLKLVEGLNEGNYQLIIPIELSKEWEAFVSEKLTNMELVKGDNLKFKLIDKEGGFQLAFGEAEFNALFREYLNEELYQSLFGHD